jgi:hypothetical protein
MFDNGPGGGMTLNWRGPLLTAGIFACVFATLLLMARQNQSNTSDMGSSLREDPYGTSLLFDSYGRAGYQVKRSQDEDSLSDENAPSTTAFFIGGRTVGGIMRKGNSTNGEKFGKRVADFLARGGRVVLVAPAWKLKSESQGWEVENKWDKKLHESGPSWISPVVGSIPADGEKMYLTADGPRLQIDAHWTILYKEDRVSDAGSDSSARVYMAKRQAGNGELIAASQESFLLNEVIKAHPSPVLLDFLAGGRPVIWVDETLHGLQQDQGVLWLVHRYRLQAALLLFWATLLTMLWSMSGDLIRRPSRSADGQIVRHGEVVGVAARRLLQRSVAKERVVAECWEQFRHCWPQDAQAISSDSSSGARLRSGLAQAPLAGYKELNQLIAERHASAKVPIKRDASDISTRNR